jgi:hypothetical protein
MTHLPPLVYKRPAESCIFSIRPCTHNTSSFPAPKDQGPPVLRTSLRPGPSMPCSEQSRRYRRSNPFTEHRVQPKTVLLQQTQPQQNNLPPVQTRTPSMVTLCTTHSPPAEILRHPPLVLHRPPLPNILRWHTSPSPSSPLPTSPNLPTRNGQRI